MALIPIDSTIPKLLHGATRPKQKVTAALNPEEQPKEEVPLKRHSHYVFFVTSVTNELPPKGTENEEVL